MKTPFEYDIFISYSQKDRAAAERLHAALEARKLKVWRDKRLTEAPAKDFIAQIDRAHERSARVLVLWSRASAISAWVLAEAEKARVAGKILPLALEPIGALLPLFQARSTYCPRSMSRPRSWTLSRFCAPWVWSRPRASRRARSPSSRRTWIFPGCRTPTRRSYTAATAEMAELLKASDDGHTRIFAFDATGGADKPHSSITLCKR